MPATVSKPIKPYALVRAFKVKDAFGEPRVFLQSAPKTEKGLPVDDTYLKMGVVFGTVDGVKSSKRDGNDGNPIFFYGLTGTFEAMPVDPTERNPSRMAVAWFPEEIQHGIEQMLSEYINHKTGEVIQNPDGADQVDLAFEVGVVASSKSSTGFVWRWTPLMELKASGDPLAHIRNALPGGALPALTDQSGVSEGEGDDAPDAAELGDQEAEENAVEAQSGNAAKAQAVKKK